MAKFLRIGVHDSNLSGYTSKAWSVRRSGSTVVLKWGAVRVIGVGPDRRIYWTVLQQKAIQCGTEARAKAYVKKSISRRMGHQYEHLPASVRIGRRPPPDEVNLARAVATILFVDIVGSTSRAARMGDRRWSEVMTHYYAAVRRELRIASGKEVTTTGDGMLATFKAAEKALRCAASIREAVRTLGLEIRAGLHAGEYQLIGGEIVGIAIHIGARVAAKARAGEVLVSSAVKERVSESAIMLKDHGNHSLKGVPRKWRLYRLDS
jgi:class 3 adenylate cyclase